MHEDNLQEGLQSHKPLNSAARQPFDLKSPWFRIQKHDIPPQMCSQIIRSPSQTQGDLLLRAATRAAEALNAAGNSLQKEARLNVLCWEHLSDSMGVLSNTVGIRGVYMPERARVEGFSFKIWVRDVQIFGASSLCHFCASSFSRGGPLHAWQALFTNRANPLHKSFRNVSRS